jgi:hypothetical protein
MTLVQDARPFNKHHVWYVIQDSEAVKRMAPIFVWVDGIASAGLLSYRPQSIVLELPAKPVREAVALITLEGLRTEKGYFAVLRYRQELGDREGVLKIGGSIEIWHRTLPRR